MKTPIVICLRTHKGCFHGIKREKKRAEKASEKNGFFCSFSFVPRFLMARAKIAKSFSDFGKNITEKYFI